MTNRTPLLAFLVLTAMPLQAQSRRVEVAIGAIRPTGDLAPYRNVGPTARIGVVFSDSTRRWRLRLDGEAIRMPGRAPGNIPPAARGDFRALGAFASMLVGPAWRAVAPYLIAGAGLQMPSVPGEANPYGSVFGTRWGAGIRFDAGRYRLAVEVLNHTVWTDYGTTEEFGRGGYRPITLSVQF